jgi:radical SAM protein with 4Fe4S-binding SPASM domain
LWIYIILVFLYIIFLNAIPLVFAILSNGNAVPCLGLKDLAIGKIDDIYGIFTEDKLLKYWDMSNRQIVQCKDCGLKYACNDCRSLETRLGASIDEKITCRR